MRDPQRPPSAPWLTGTTSRSRPADHARLARNRQDEIDNVRICAAMAEAEPQLELAAVYRRLSEAEARHDSSCWR